MTDEVRPADAEIVHQVTEPGRLPFKCKRSRQPAAASVARAMIAKQAETARESRLFKQRIEPVGTGTVVHEHDVFAGAVISCQPSRQTLLVPAFQAVIQIGKRTMIHSQRADDARVELTNSRA